MGIRPENIGNKFNDDNSFSAKTNFDLVFKIS